MHSPFPHCVLSAESHSLSAKGNFLTNFIEVQARLSVFPLTIKNTLWNVSAPWEMWLSRAPVVPMHFYVFRGSREPTTGVCMSLCFIPPLLIPKYYSVNNEQQIIFSFTSQTCWGDEIPLLCVYMCPKLLSVERNLINYVVGLDVVPMQCSNAGSKSLCECVCVWKRAEEEGREKGEFIHRLIMDYMPLAKHKLGGKCSILPNIMK